MRSQPWERIDRDVAKRYEVRKKIGRGYYGVVWEVAGRELALEHCFAMKKVLYAFRNHTDAQRTYREVVYLQQLGQHENILKLHDVLVSANDQHLYIITDLLDSDLSKAMKCKVLDPVHKILISYQLLRALKYIHSASIMHRDVKPSNILLDASCQAVLADFGWARSSPCAGQDLINPMTEYASTRWYRAPEMLMGSRWYTVAIDIWAFACVVAEMYLEAPLVKGTSTLDMLTKVEEMLGKPPPEDFEMMEAPFALLSRGAMVDGPPHVSLDQIFLEQDELFIDFLKLLLQYNPLKRMTATEALTHPFLGPFHNPDAEPICEHRIEVALPDDESVTASRYRDQIYADILALEASRRRLEDEGRQDDRRRGGSPGAAQRDETSSNV